MGQSVKKSGIGGRARTMAWAGPTDLLFGSRGVPVAYHHLGILGPHTPCPRGPLVTIAEAREEEHTRRGEWVPTWRTSSPFVKDHVENVVMSEYLRKNPTRSRVAAGAKGLGATANAVRQNRPRGMEMAPSPVRRMFSAPSDSEGYHTCYLSDDAGVEPDFSAGRSHTAPNLELAHDAEQEPLTRRAATY